MLAPIQTPTSKFPNWLPSDKGVIWLRSMLREAPIINALIASCAIMSSYSMFTGILAMNENGGIAMVIGAAVFSAIVAGILTFAIRRLFRARSLSERAMAFAAWATAAFFTIAFGFGLWFSIFSSAELTREEMREAVGTFMPAMTAYQASYSGLNDASADIAAYSKTQSDIEFSQNGGTCQDGPGAGGDGPRTRLRKSDMETFARFAGHFSKKHAALNEAVNSAKAATAQFEPSNFAATNATIQKAFETARISADDPILAQWNTKLAERIGHSNSIIMDPVSGPFRCADPILSAKLSLASVTLPKLPEKLPAITPPNHSESVRRGLNIVMGRTTWQPRLDALPFSTGAALDVFILLLAWFRSRNERDGADGGVGTDPTAETPNQLLHLLNGKSVLGGISAQIASMLEAAPWAFFETLEKHSFTDRKWTWIFMPIDAEGNEAQMLRRSMRLLQSTSQLKFWSRSKTADLPKRWWTVIERVNPEVTSVDTYRMPASAFRAIEIDWMKSQVSEPASDAPIFFTSTAQAGR